MSLTYLRYTTGLFSSSMLKRFVSSVPMKKIAIEGASGFPILTPSICVYNFLLYWNRPVFLIVLEYSFHCFIPGSQKK